MSEDTQRRDSAVGPASRRIWILAILLFVTALIPRVVNLGRLSLYADEDISVLTAAAVAAGDGSVLPSGMAYRRALPFTWLNAASIRLLGEPTELTIRLPTAILGALTVPVLFLMGRRFVGFGGGLTAGVFLAVSEWHLVFSRQSRMYVSLLLFVVLATWALWAWVRTGRRSALLAGLAASTVAVLLHKLAILLAGAPLVWLAFPGAVAVSMPAIFAIAGVIAAAGWAISELWVTVPYRTLTMPPGVPAAASTTQATSSQLFGAPSLVFAAVGLLLALDVIRRTRPPPDGQSGAWLRRSMWTGLAMLIGVAAGLGQVYLLGLVGAMFLLLDGRGMGPLLTRGRLPFVALLGLLALRVGARIPDAGLVEALKLAAAFPYPHAYTLVAQAPAPTILFGVAALSLILFPYDESRLGMAAATLLVFGTLLVLGIAREAGPTRYLMTAYPLMLLVAGTGLFDVTRWGLDRFAARAKWGTGWTGGAASVLTTLVVLSGVLRGHGVEDAIRLVELSHGEPVNELTHMFPFRPDHRSAGRYAREHRAEGDLVVVEDPLMQIWYAGHVDFWFRGYADMREYLRVQPDGSLRDIYAGSEPLVDPAIADSIASAASGRVWFITSGETAPLAAYYLSAEQREWLDSLRRARAPEFVGEDGVSAVYCLNCTTGEDGGTGPKTPREGSGS